MPVSTPPVETPICPTCGIIALPSRLACGRCQSPITLTVAPRRPDGGYFACIECELTCSACGGVTPLDHVDVDVPAVCALCGTSHPLPPDVFQRTLAFAQAVADLAGPSPEGRDSALNLQNLSVASINPRAAIGVSRTFAVETIGGVRVTASPGHPLCVRCNAPLELTLDPPSAGAPATMRGPSATSRCPGCNERGIYAVPHATHAASPPLQAIVATEHRTDRAPVVLGEKGALLCPDCGEPMAADGSSKFVTCGACKTSSRLPDGAFFRLRPGPRPPEPIWLLFRGASAERQGLLATARATRDADRAQKERVDAAFRARHANVVRAKKEMRAGRVRGLLVFASLVGLVAALAWGVPQLVPYERAAAPNACMARAWKLCDDQARIFAADDPKTAAALWTDACRGGFAPSCTHEGELEEERNAAGAAAILYERACTAGEMAGCARLGSLYERGLAGLSRDYARAAELYRRSCDGGGGLGCANLAAMVEAGRGVARNEDNAVMLYERACSARDGASCMVLAERQHAGRGAKRDDEASSRWRREACELGRAAACAR